MNIVAGGNLIDMQFLVDDDSDPIWSNVMCWMMKYVVC